MSKKVQKKKKGRVFLSREAAQFKGLFSPKYEKWLLTEVELLAQNNFGTWSSVEEAGMHIDKAIKELAKTIATAVEPEVKRIIDEHKEDIVSDMAENVVAGPNLPQMGPSTPAPAPTTEAFPAEEPKTLSPTPASRLGKVTKLLRSKEKLFSKAPQGRGKIAQDYDDFEEDPSVMYLPDEFGEDISVGDRVQVSEGSGTWSGIEAIVVDQSNVETDGRGIPTNVPGAYQPVNWDEEVALQLEDGSIDVMFIDRLKKVSRKIAQIGSDDFGEDRGYSVVFDISTQEAHFPSEEAGASEEAFWEAKEEIENLFNMPVSMSFEDDYAACEFTNWVDDIQKVAAIIVDNDSTINDGTILISNGMTAQNFRATKGHLGRPDSLVDYDDWDDAFGVNDLAPIAKKAKMTKKLAAAFDESERKGDNFDDASEGAEKFIIDVIMQGGETIPTAYGDKTAKGILDLLKGSGSEEAADVIMQGRDKIQTAHGIKSREGFADLLESLFTRRGKKAALELRPLGANVTEVETDNVVVLFSYSTPVAYMDKGSGQFFRTTERFSNTTSKHINKWLEGNQAEEVDQSQIEGLVQTANAETYSIESMDKEEAERILGKVIGQKVDLEEFKEDLEEEQNLEGELKTQDDLKPHVQMHYEGVE